MLHRLAKFAHARKPAYARPPFCDGSNPCPRVRIHIIKHNKKSRRWACFLLWRRRRIPSHGTACRLWGNRNDLTALYLSNLLVVEPAICDCDGFAPFHFTGNNKKCPARAFLLFLAVQVIFYLWLMKDLCPRHNQNSQNHKKTGKNREFLQKMAFFWHLLHNLD